MPLSMRSCCGFQAAPRIVGGSLSISSDSNVLTWAKNPQKSQMMSAHLKFGGSALSVCFFYSLGRPVILPLVSRLGYQIFGCVLSCEKD